MFLSRQFGHAGHSIFGEKQGWLVETTAPSRVRCDLPRTRYRGRRPGVDGIRESMGSDHRRPGRQGIFERSMPADLIRGWIPVRVKKTRQNKNLELRF
jgi:hypothetical protein